MEKTRCQENNWFVSKYTFQLFSLKNLLGNYNEKYYDLKIYPRSLFLL